MLLNSGTTSLLTFTRFMARDPAAAPNPLFSDAQVKATINVVYLLLRDKMRAKGVGHGHKRTYADSVADQIFYNKPADMVRPVSLELESLGKDLSSSSEADVNPIFFTPKEGKEALQAYHAGTLSGSTYVFVHDEHYGIVAPPSAAQAGTAAIRLLYEASSAELVSDTDEPILPRPHHPLICYRSAVVLLVAKGLDLGELAGLVNDSERLFIQGLSDNFENLDEVIPAAGLVASRGLRTKTGAIVRSN